MSAIDVGQRTKALIVFDLDGTLAESKSAIDEEMATLDLCRAIPCPTRKVIGTGVPGEVQNRTGWSQKSCAASGAEASAAAAAATPQNHFRIAVFSM